MTIVRHLPSVDALLLEGLRHNYCQLASTLLLWGQNNLFSSEHFCLIILFVVKCSVSCRVYPVGPDIRQLNILYLRGKSLKTKRQKHNFFWTDIRNYPKCIVIKKFVTKIFFYRNIRLSGQISGNLTDIR